MKRFIPGKSRLCLLRHRHEILSGRTSSISHEIIGFDPQGMLINYASANITTWEQICETSSKIVTFLDLPGFSKYEKTMLTGLTGKFPDYACLIVGANSGGMTPLSIQHLKIAVEMKLPIFVVITKIDDSSSEQLTQTLKKLLFALKSPFVARQPVIMGSQVLSL